MPSLILTGHPSTGKTTFAHLLSTRALAHKSGSIKRTVIINEESECPDKTKSECYSDSNSEKSTRSALKAEFDRHNKSTGNSSTLVILDSMNYIKGFRYELHCISKAARESHGIVWVMCSATKAKEWNEIRKDKGDGFYLEETMDALVMRYEPPDGRNRWDKPLYRVDMHQSDETTGAAEKDVLEKSVYNMHSLDATLEHQNDQRVTGGSDNGKKIAATDERDIRADLERKADDILDSFLSCRPLKEGMATQQHVSAESNVLHKVDSVAKKVSKELNSFMKMSPSSCGKFSMSGVSKTIVLTRAIHLPEMRRLTRQFVKWTTAHPPDDTTEGGVASAFLSYIETQL